MGFVSASDSQERCTWVEDGQRCEAHPVAYLGDDRSTCYEHSWKLAERGNYRRIDEEFQADARRRAVLK